MRNKFLLLAFLGLSTGAFAQFTTGNIAVVRIGNGSTTLNAASAATAILDHSKVSNTYSTGAALNNGSGVKLTNSGSASSEGALALSADGKFLTLGGYDTGVGTASVAGTASSTVNRVAAAVDMSGAVSYTATTLYSANNIRSVWSTNGTEMYTGGPTVSGSGGINYMNGGAPVNVATTNTRVVGGFGGDLYFTTQSGAFTGLNKFTGMPNGSAVSTNLFTEASMSPYGFWFKDANTVYVADDRTGTGGGIGKWTYSSGVWTKSYVLSTVTGTAGTGARGLTGEVDALGNVTLYATTVETTNNRLVSIVDSGASSTATLIDNAGANYVYRGVALAPVPEPASMLALGLGLTSLIAKRRRK